MKNNHQLTTFSFSPNHPISPALMYLQIYPQLISLQKRIHVTGPISSGWVALDSHFEILEAIKLNCQFAQLLINSYLENGFWSEAHCTLPHLLGKCYRFYGQRKTTWRQFDYLILWVMVMLGLKPSQVNNFVDFVEKEEIHKDVFNDHQAERELRQKEHQKLLNLVLSFVSNLDNSDFNLIDKLVILPLAESSLGSVFEMNLSKHLGISAQRLVFDDDFLKNYPQIIYHPVYKYIQQNHQV